MGIADITKQAKRRELKTLILDIERLPGRFAAEFWDLNAFKGRRIHPDMVTEWPRTICAAWAWLGDRRVEFASEWDDGPQQMAHRCWDAFNQADIVVGHNMQGFDRKHLNTLFRDNGLTPPAPYKVIDTLTVARGQFGDESKTMDALCKRIGIPAKTDKYDPQVAREAVDGNVKAQRKLKAYNVGDIHATAALYMALLPWSKGHPHVAPATGQEANCCPRCASINVKRNGTYSPSVWVYKAYVCNDCGGHYRTTYESKGPSVRAL